MKEILLTQGFAAQVDDHDYVWLSAWKWCANRTINSNPAVAARYEGKKYVYMHRQIMNTPKGMLTDHINHNTLDNQRHNLRVCTYSQNNTNHTKTLSTSSQYLGVYWKKDRAKWYAQIHLDGKQKYLGYFSNEEEAAREYDKAVIRYRDEYATINFGE